MSLSKKPRVDTIYIRERKLMKHVTHIVPSEPIRPVVFTSDFNSRVRDLFLGSVFEPHTDPYCSLRPMFKGTVFQSPSGRKYCRQVYSFSVH